MFIGLRVIRGPDWSSAECDGGEGHVGTVATIEGAGAVDVIWDSGQRTTCTAGKDGKHDLRIYDSATVGIRHKDVKCSSCDVKDIFGTKWTCTQCKDVVLCPPCYFADKHDLGHVFNRHDKPGSEGVKVTKRSSSLKLRALGLFPGARVVRGEDWKWGDQDGGRGSKGEITAIPDEPGASSIRNVVRVKWNNGRSNIYRIGHEGKMDLKYTEESPGPGYYRDHLQLLDVSSVQKGVPANTKLETGSKVCIRLEKEDLKQVQTDKGGWSAGLASCIGKIGTIKTFPSKDVAAVMFGDSQYRIATDALSKVYEHSMNDTVRILPDRKKVKVLQDGHGEWNDKMEKTLGKVGRVGRVDSDGDVVVVFGSTKWIYNPACCVPAPGERVEDVEPGGQGGGGEAPAGLSELQGHLAEFLAGLLDMRGLGKLAEGRTASGDIVKAIRTGNLEAVKAIVKADPKKAKSECREELTPLMVACHEGQIDIVRFLLDEGVDTEYIGHKGSTALAVALIGQKEKIAALLIDRGADVNCRIEDEQTALHVAANLNLHASIKLLIAKGCDVNAVDRRKNTALHTAVETRRNDSVKALLECPKLNLRLCNKHNFNPLHLACLRGNAVAVEKILQRDSSFVNVLMADDAFSALHIAAANDHVECARLLIDTGKATVDRKGHKDLTPLHITCTRPYIRVVEILLEKGGDVNALSEIGDTPLHYLFIHCSKKRREQNSLSPAEVETYARVAFLLLDKQAAYRQKNYAGFTPLELCESGRVKMAVQKYIEQKKATLNSNEPKVTSPRGGKQALGQTNTLREFALPCSQCYNRISDVTLKPCNHKVLCLICCRGVSKCPMCDVTIERKVTDVEEDLRDACKMQ